MRDDVLDLPGAKLNAFFRFPVAVAMSATITLGLPILLVTFMGVAEKVAVAIAMIVAFFINFFVNKFFVFQSTHKGTKQLIRFFFTNIFMRVVDYLGFLMLFEWVGLHYIVSLFMVLSCTTIVRFFMFNRIFAKA